MKRFIKIFLIMIFMAQTLIGCGKSIEQQVIEQLELGNRYLAEMDYEQAIVAFTKAIELEPREIQAYTSLIVTYIESGQPENARQVVADATELFVVSDTNVEAGMLQEFLIQAVRYYEVQNELEDTCSYWKDVLSALNDRDEYRDSLKGITQSILDKCLSEADQSYEGEDIPKAIDILEMAIEMSPASPDGYSKLADIYIAQAEWDKAIEILQRGYENSGDEALNEKLSGLNKPSGDTPVEWDDPIFESMVRQKIGISEGTVYTKDLDYITSLAVLGNTHIFVNSEGVGEDGPIWSYCWTRNSILNTYYGFDNQKGGVGEREFKVKGNIESVNALMYFRNLKIVAVIANHITDISVLGKMDLLSANFFANDIKDTEILKKINEDDDTQCQFIEIGDIVTE